jgi:hypothetical protein
MKTKQQDEQVVSEAAVIALDERNRMKTPNTLLATVLALLAAISTAHATVRYVNANSATPTPPYTNWATAATTIQQAVGAAVAGDEIVVTNGTYGPVSVNKALTVQSVNGPNVTVINGGDHLGHERCATLFDVAVMVGFTLTNGAAGEGQGGGVLCESAGAVLSNCVLTGNSANSGGGAYGGTLNNCTLTGNSAYMDGGGAYGCTLGNCTLTGNSAEIGGGAYGCTLYNCTLTGNLAEDGGGAYGGTLNNCALTGNSAEDGSGGGAYYGTLNNCTLTGNSAYMDGGGAYGGTLNNCTLTGNLAGSAGGAYNCTLNNCIAYYNSGSEPNYDPSSTLNYCCTTPLPGGIGNITNTPLFVDYAGGNLRLQSDSPCINSGDNAYVVGTTDLDGNPRIVGGTVDIGAYEYQTPTSILSYAWLQQYGLPTDGSADYADTDGTGQNNLFKWVAGLDPTNPASVFVLNIASVPNPSQAMNLNFNPLALGRAYTPQFSTDLVSGVWMPLTTYTGPLTNGNQVTITDTNPIPPQEFYRIDITLP